jgi:hypothetical protein
MKPNPGQAMAKAKERSASLMVASSANFASKMGVKQRSAADRVAGSFPTEGPSWGYPVFVLGAVCSFLWGNIVES